VASQRKSPQRAGQFAQAAAEEFRLLVEGVKDYAIFLLDRDGQVMSWNAGAERIKQFRADEVLGEHFSRFYPPEAREAGRPAEALAAAAREGRFEGYGWRVRKDGSRFYAHVTITALYDEHGDLHGFAKVTQDITAQREADQLLRQREQQLAEAQAIAELGGFEWSVAADQLAWSPELGRIYGLEPLAFTSTLQRLASRSHPDDRPLLVEALRRAASSGGSFRLEHRIVRPDGEVRYLLTRGRVPPDERGRPRRVLGVCQDLTEQRERERQLAEASAQADLSRELQTGLLPVLVLRDPALVLRTRYRAGQERALLGADFYDALELPDGTVATLIGDVAGHGPGEAAVGVALRAAWRALILAGHGPKDVLDGLDRVLQSARRSEELFATACCLWVSPDRSSVAVALAGHPPPLLAVDGKVEVAEVSGGPALGILDVDYPWEASTLEVGDAWTLLCYTDGLIEGLRAPGSVERFGVEALREAAAELLEGGVCADRLLDGLLDVVLEANGQDLSDDIAMLCLTTAEVGARR
jgi:PAS domain S-box-containing protein